MVNLVMYLAIYYFMVIVLYVRVCFVIFLFYFTASRGARCYVLSQHCGVGIFNVSCCCKY